MQQATVIGVAGQPWGDAERALWRSRQSIHRRYAEDVLAALGRVDPALEVIRYGELAYPPDYYPLVALRSRDWDQELPAVLVTGGVHGYETSGVHGALRFAERHGAEFGGRLNVLVVPCVSPWAYERIHRWNPEAIDPNRSFRSNSPSPEAAALMALVEPISAQVLVHVDLHETTDSDESEFRPALAARDGKVFEPGLIPDGFYVVGDGVNPQLEFQSAIIEAVARVTHIAPCDHEGNIIGSKTVAPGVILYPFRKLGLCAGLTPARYTTTTEVYPDSPRATPEICIEAQVEAIRAAIRFALAVG